jgi:hypothetical protein
MKNKLMVILLFAIACDERVDLIQSGLVTGKITYVNERTGTATDVPKGTPVRVIFNANASPYYGYSFKTSEDGVYSFRPQVGGTYDLVVSLRDTLVQFDAGLVVAQLDLDPERKSEYLTIEYKDSVHLAVSEKSKILSKNISLIQTATNLRLSVKDELGNPVRSARVCLYDNASFADKNSPYCGGSISYLSSNENGEVFFTGLSGREYFVVARGKVGNVSLDNQFAGSVKSIGVLAVKKTNMRDVILK